MQHLCLVSAQPIPNLTPALDNAFKPEKVILAVSPQMKEQAKHQEMVLKRFQVPVEQLLLPDAYDISVLLDTFMKFLDEHEGEEIFLNATGGTKPMAIAAQEAFRMAGLPVFYVHDREDKIIWLDKKKAPQDIATRMKLEPFLQAHGYKIESVALPKDFKKEWMPFIDEVLQLNEKDANAIAALNAVAAEAKKNKLEGKLTGEAKNALDKLLGKMYELGILKYYDDRKVNFTSEAARFFVNGGWLEVHLHNSLSQIKDLQDYAINMKVMADNETPNELDGAILYKNKLTLVECKTCRYDNSSVPDISSALYKLDSLTALGGLRTAGIFVSYFPLPDFILDRAKTLKIHICHGSRNIQRLTEVLKEKVLK